MGKSLEKSPRITAEDYFRMTADLTDKTELRNGEIVSLASPGRTHQRISSHLHHAVEAYIRKNGGSCEVNEALNARLDDSTVVIPDVMVVCDSEKMDEKGCNGAPDWVIEIVSANRRDDFIYKLALYQDSGVREYWIIDPKNEKTLVYFFEQSDFPDIYTFDAAIPVGISGGKLAVRITDLL